MSYLAEKAQSPLTGSLRVPGDKSLSHRAVLFAAMAEGRSDLAGVLDSEDVRSTIDAVRALGALIEEVPGAPSDSQGLHLRVTGWGDRGPNRPAGPLDCGNSGTTTRMLMGVLAGWPVEVELTGDESLSRRPMLRVIQPLAMMGASFDTTDGHLPVRVRGRDLHAIEYDSPVASAQVKSAVMLAGLRATGTTVVREPAPSRDHTERLLPAFGVPVERDASTHACWLEGPGILSAADFAVPGDPSSAAFLVAAACLVPGSDLTLVDVGLNPTRCGFADVLLRMGADVRVTETHSAGSEPIGTMAARHSTALRATVVSANEVPSLVDEVPILALVASQAAGTTRFEGVGELKVKESDRLEAIRAGLAALGVQTAIGEDWLEVSGPAPLFGAHLDSLGDHRLAMTWAVAGLIATETVEIERFESVAVSYPGFRKDLRAALLQRG